MGGSTKDFWTSKFGSSAMNSSRIAEISRALWWSIRILRDRGIGMSKSALLNKKFKYDLPVSSVK